FIASTVQRSANEFATSKVREMNENERMDLDVIKGLFGQGVFNGYRNICYPRRRKHFSRLLSAIEEPAKVDVHDTSVNTIGHHHRHLNTRLYVSCLVDELKRSQDPSVCQNWLVALQTEVQEIGDSTHCALDGMEMWIPDLTKPTYFWSSINIVRSKGYKGITYFVATKDVDIEIAQKEQKP
ncbi:hypothetical protein EV360DRAFT_50955, partial [Lentinula raphanica]